MSDEVAALRQALRRGQWQRLTDPLLESVLLTRPDLWPAIVRTCSRALAVAVLQDDGDAVERVMAWTSDVAPRPTVVGLRLLLQRTGTTVTVGNLISQTVTTVPLERRARVLLALARGAIGARPTPEWVAALAVLERWPVE